MRVLGTSELRTVEHPDHLQFIYGYEAGWGDLLAPPAALIVVLAWAWSTHHMVLGAIFVVVFAALVVYWLNISPARLSVSIDNLVAQGSHNRNVRAEAIIFTADLKSFGYLAEGLQGPAGLYAHHGQKQTCLIPGITSEQAVAIANIIRRRFPNLERGENIHTSQEIRMTEAQPYVSLTGLPIDPPSRD